MKRKILKEIPTDVSICNICKDEITKEPFSKTRIEIVRHLFDTTDFDAHEVCINKVTKEAFESFIMPENPPLTP